MNENINCIIYKGVLIPDTPPHIEIYLEKKEIEDLFKKFNPYFIRFTNEWDRGKGEFWYVIKDEKEDWGKYSSNTRNQIRKGLKNCQVEKISKDYLAENGYNVYKNAFKRYKTFLKSVSKIEFKNSILNSKNCDYWGVFYNNQLITYSQNIIIENVCNYSTVKIDPAFIKLYPSYALFHEMNKYYLNEKNFLYVSDGARNLSHFTNIQNFLIQKFKFRKAYCRLNVIYKKDIEFLVKFFYPFRKIIYKLNNKFFQKLAVLLKHEEIRRSYD